MRVPGAHAELACARLPLLSLYVHTCPCLLLLPLHVHACPCCPCMCTSAPAETVCACLPLSAPACARLPLVSMHSHALPKPFVRLLAHDTLAHVVMCRPIALSALYTSALLLHLYPHLASRRGPQTLHPGTSTLHPAPLPCT